MPRPSKEKRICRLPGCGFFVPGEGGQPTHRIRMTVEEYETIRLIDYMGYTQEECAVQMEVGRATARRSIRKPGRSWRVFWWRRHLWKSAAGATESAGRENTGRMRAFNHSGEEIQT